VRVPKLPAGQLERGCTIITMRLAAVRLAGAETIWPISATAVLYGQTVDDDRTSARERFDHLAATYRNRSGVEHKQVDDQDVLIVNTEPFAVLAGDRLTIRLPAPSDRLSSEWMAIGADPNWCDLADGAYRYVATSTGVTRQPVPTIADPHEVAELVADAFDLGHPDGPMTPGSPSSQETWRLDTTAGSFLVKRFWRGTDVPWRVTLQRAMEFEAVALSAGIDSPPPVPPRRPQFAAATSIEGLGVFRAYPFLEHRPLEPADDITDWYARTLARIQQLEPVLTHTPLPSWWYNQFPAVPPEQWQRWVEQGRQSGRSWAEELAERVPVLVELTNRVVEAFADGAPHVMTHRDVETWNILMVPAGAGWRPMLVDWDVAGPDSAALEAAHVLTEYAAFGRQSPDPARLRRGIDVYRSEGGAALDATTDILARRLGMRVARIAGRVRSSLDAPSAELRTRADLAIVDYLDGLPGFVAGMADRARLF